MKTYMFPGQGSQAKGMGAGLFERFPELCERADAVLGYSIRELCLEDPQERLGKTQYTQPALYVVNALSGYARIEDAGRPDFLAGHSLGEFNALLAAGCFDFETGLRLVQKRGELMGQVAGGGMAAVLNASREQIEQILADNGLSNLSLANYNSPSQIVISGLAEEIARARECFKQGKIRFYPLNTSGAFHSAYMRESMEAFRAFLQKFEFASPAIPVIANVSARPYQADALLDTLARQIASTVQWSDSVQYLLALAHARNEPIEFVELGPGEVLTRLVEAIRQQTPATRIEQILSEEKLASTQRNAAEVPTPATAAPTVSTPPQVGATPAHQLAAEGKIAHWNQQHPVGTAVRSKLLPEQTLETRSEAVLLFGHRAAVYLKGYNGYFDLDELSAA